MFLLALELGKTIGEMMATMSLSEFRQWQAYYSLNPFGTFRNDFNSAKVCCAMQGGKIADFMPDFGGETKPPDPEQLSNRLQSYFQSKAQ